MSLDMTLTFGDFDVTPYLTIGSDLGNPENVTSILASLLADGEIESLDRRSNRVMTIPLELQGADLLELAELEAALVAECDKQRNTLTLDPGDFGPATVFDTFAAQPTRLYDDYLEMSCIRGYAVTIRALPYARSVDLISDDAGTPPSSGGTLLYNCESTSGWSKWQSVSGGGGVGSSITVDAVIFTEGAGSIKAQANRVYAAAGYGAKFTNADEKTGLSLSTGAGGYLSVAIRWVYDDDLGVTRGLSELWTTVGGVETQVTNFVATTRDAAGFVHYVWPVDAGLTVTDLRFSVVQTSTNPSAVGAYVWYDDVELLPSATTDKQIVKQLTVKGSARTVGSMRISSASSSVALGNVLVSTRATATLPAGFQMNAGRWVSQGTTTVDATAINGTYYTPSTTIYDTAAGKPIFDVPASALTAGEYVAVALVKAEAATLSFGVQAQLRVGSTDVGPTSVAEVSRTGLTTGWQFIPIDTLYLPPLPVQNADVTTKVRLLFKGAKMADVYLIPAWEVGGRPVADFAIVDCGSSTVSSSGSSSSLWIESPSLTQPQGGYWRGPTTDRANARSAWPDTKKTAQFVFPPGELTAELVATNSAGPTLELSYFPTHVGSATL